MSRKSLKEIQIDTNLRCQKIYPVEYSRRTLDSLQTIGIVLTKQQAIVLSRALLVASQDWDVIEVTGYRLKKRVTDSTHQLTVTSFEKENR